MIDFNLYLPEKISHIFPPVIVNVKNPYIAIGGNWISIPREHMYQILEEAIKRWSNPYQIKDTNNKFKVIGDSGKEYTVSINNGNYSCSCKGFQFRRNCSHIDKIKEGKNISIPKDIKTHIWTSDTGKTKYKVTCMDGVWKCSCSSKSDLCKHIKEIKEKVI